MQSTEIERKFIIPTLPDFITSTPISYERHYIYSNKEIELRVQKKGEKYELERKQVSSEHGRETVKVEISENEFNELKKLSKGSIIRDSYLVEDDKYDISIKVYHGSHEGLIRVEVEFESEDDAKSFEPYDWMGKEITESELGRDSRLLGVSNDRFNTIMQEFL